jgi:hypothetical protein
MMSGDEVTCNLCALSLIVIAAASLLYKQQELHFDSYAVTFNTPNQFFVRVGSVTCLQLLQEAGFHAQAKLAP